MWIKFNNFKFNTQNIESTEIIHGQNGSLCYVRGIVITFVSGDIKQYMVGDYEEQEISQLISVLNEAAGFSGYTESISCANR